MRLSSPESKILVYLRGSARHGSLELCIAENHDCEVYPLSDDQIVTLLADLADYVRQRHQRDFVPAHQTNGNGIHRERHAG